MVHWVRPDCARGLVRTQERRVSRRCFNTVGIGSWIAQVLEQLTISGGARHGETDLESRMRLRAPMSWQDAQHKLRNTKPRSALDQSTQPMDVGALTWRNCWACGSHTHERKDCWYTNVTCKKCGKRGRMTSVCWVNAGKAQKGKGKSESKGEKGDIQAVLLKWTRIEKLIQSELMNQHSKLTKLIQNEQLKPNSELITHGSMKQNWTDGTFPIQSRAFRRVKIQG